MNLQKSKRAVDEIIVHCTATPAGRPVNPAQIDAWHRARGYDGIGYHYVVDLDGRVHDGRHVDSAGAHCLGHNVRSIGVVYVGGTDAAGQPADTRTPAQRGALLNLLRELRRLYPRARIHGHCDFARKACPSFDATAEYRRLIVMAVVCVLLCGCSSKRSTVTDEGARTEVHSQTVASRDSLVLDAVSAAELTLDSAEIVYAAAGERRSMRIRARRLALKTRDTLVLHRGTAARSLTHDSVAAVRSRRETSAAVPHPAVSPGGWMAVGAVLALGLGFLLRRVRMNLA